MATNCYIPIGGGYEYCKLRVGIVMRNATGQEIYIQPGDAENAACANFDALDEISLDASDPKRGQIANMLFGEYFGG